MSRGVVVVGYCVLSRELSSCGVIEFVSLPGITASAIAIVNSIFAQNNRSYNDNKQEQQHYTRQ